MERMTSCFVGSGTVVKQTTWFQVCAGRSKLLASNRPVDARLSVFRNSCAARTVHKQQYRPRRIAVLACAGASGDGGGDTNTAAQKSGGKKNRKGKNSADESVYKKTVNLPETVFEQRANAVSREPELQALWASLKVYEKLSRNNDGEKFVLHDGPPYANGALHMGHALNKVLKDFINRYQLLRGRRGVLVPGWDCHGLPIELKVLQSRKKKAPRLEPKELRKVAADFARETVNAQREQFQRLGVWADWNAPYLTLQKEYEAAQIGVFGDMLLRGHIYRGKKPVHWSPSSRTALAEAELEYPEGHVSRSIYGSFRVQPDEKMEASEAATILREKGHFERDLRLAIWTTTPWTLPANLAVGVNVRLEYALVLDKERDSVLVVAKDLVETLAGKLERELEVLGDVKGKELVGLTYEHPLRQNVTCPVVAGGDYITTESGTGLVHTAPGHGQEDYVVGMREKLEMVSPVDDAGRFTAEAVDGQLEGMSVLTDGNEACIKMALENGALLLEEPYAHKYPYDWRTKKPTIFRCTEQWFASVDGFRERALDAIKDDVAWVPASGEKRIHNMVEGRADWCISRQRVWGVPIPVFYEADTREPVLDDEIIRAVQQLFRKKGSDSWFEMQADEILPEKYRGRGLVKGTDTMDVWFDSGCSWAAVSDSRDSLNFPADLYLEGSDQHRGWFQSSLLTSVASRGEAPYRRVLTHGFVLDEKGIKMSKSIGNVVDPMEIIAGGPNKKTHPAYGADVLRLWVASADYSNDVLIGPGILKQIADSYRKLRNTLRYLIGNTSDFDPKRDGLPLDQLPALDRYMLGSLARVAADAQKAYDEFQFVRVYQLLLRFATVDLSNFYLDIAKDRLYIAAPSAARRRSCQTVLALLLQDITVLLAPILPHMAEDVYQALPATRACAEPSSLFEHGWLDSDALHRELWSSGADEHGKLEQTWKEIRAARDVVNRCMELARSEKTIGASLDAKVRIYVPTSANAMVEALSSLRGGRLGATDEVDSLSSVFIASDVEVVTDEELVRECRHVVADESDGPTKGMVVGVDRAEGTKCERCWCIDPAVGSSAQHPTLCVRCDAAVSEIGFPPQPALSKTHASAEAEPATAAAP